MDLEKFDIFLQEGVYGKVKSKKYIEMIKEIKSVKDIKTLADIIKRAEAFFKKKILNKDEYMDIANKVADKNIK